MGRIVALDTPHHLIDGLEAPFQLRLRLSEPIDPTHFEGICIRNVEAVGTEQGQEYHLQVTNISATLLPLLVRLTQLNTTILDLSMEQATLEDVFLALTGKELRN